jgi:adenylate cyclase
MVQANPSLSTTHFLLAIALALAGRMEEAGLSVRRGLELEPGFRFRALLPPGLSQARKEKLSEAARLLGLLE